MLNTVRGNYFILNGPTAKFYVSVIWSPFLLHENLRLNNVPLIIFFISN